MSTDSGRECLSTSRGEGSAAKEKCRGDDCGSESCCCFVRLSGALGTCDLNAANDGTAIFASEACFLAVRGSGEVVEDGGEITIGVAGILESGGEERV